MCTSKSLWTEWMKSMHLKEQHIWGANAHLVGFKYLEVCPNPEAVRSTLHQESIGNGQHTSLWYDPWLNEGKNSRYYWA